MAKRPEWLNLAQVITTLGVRGELKVRPETDDPLRLRDLQEVSALLATGARETLGIERVTLRKDGVVIAKFRGHDAPETAARLRQAWLQVPYAEAKRVPGQVLYADVLGMAVVDAATGDQLGEVSDVLRAGQDLLQVTRPDGAEVLVPWVDAFVAAVDREANQVRVHVLEGLLD
ncbi:MAG: ribosome maturation factor RimM [Candidatus Sericytochromatia bacterium]|nr:ribosome maturation factor RimM [Candidatus Sericytochromatia bacterium]